jgi:hypothetical protein
MLVFVVEDARSGATYLTKLLNVHPDIKIIGESNFVVTLLRQYPKGQKIQTADFSAVLNELFAEEKFKAYQLGQADLQEYIQPKLPLTIEDLIVQIIIFLSGDSKQEKKIYGVKKGSYIHNLDLIFSRLPESRFIHIVRDARAVFNSKRQNIYTEKGEYFERNPVRGAMRWNRIIKSFNQFSKKHGDRSIEIKYEDLIRKPDETLLGIQRFLGIPERAGLHKKINESSFEVHKRYAHLHKNVGKSVDRSRIEAWKEELPGWAAWTIKMIAWRNLSLKKYIN